MDKPGFDAEGKVDSSIFMCRVGPNKKKQFDCIKRKTRLLVLRQRSL